MIVNYKETGWEVITQRAHGIVAAEVAMQWKASERPQRWLETIIAIAEHDDAEVELGGEKLITETGGPLNFSMKKFDIEHCRHLATLSITKSRYMALLASKHMEFLHRKEEAENPEVHEFLQAQRALQNEWQQQLRIDKNEAARIYYLLEWCDAFSLLLCRQLVQPEKRGIEISTGPDGEIYQLFELEEGKFTVEPWPFESESFTVRYESREINQLKFESSEEFRKLFIEAPVTDNVWEVARIGKGIKKPSKV